MTNINFHNVEVLTKFRPSTSTTDTEEGAQDDSEILGENKQLLILTDLSLSSEINFVFSEGKFFIVKSSLYSL